ncbi:alpha-glucosidase [Noviherbaspirillum sp.]|jgi:alpha-glucosidase|uniref:alpha-glucosidase n=1 Tax=Noviherbaspirillum sp. TaxID=1926288 RepID=UPI0025E02923|nr:alpha-glucosidase [Noviherbaspirillum sp.]
MIIYQVYPRSFFDANNDGIGDLVGIEKKLSYIKSLGVDAIWISPFFKSPMKDFGYDVADYREVDPIFGSMDDFKSLLQSAKSLGLGVIVDMVISHTSEEHPWFVQSRVKENNRSDWYLWADPNPDGTPPNNWVSVFGGPAWQWDAGRRQYYFHSFLPSQPDLNMHHPDVQKQVLADMRFWLEMGVSGFRFDACNHIFQDLQLRSNPPREDNSGALHPYGYQVHVYDQAQPEMLPFLEKVRGLLDEYGAFSLAEVGGHDALKLMGEYTGATRLHSAYSFAMMRPESSAAYVRNVIATLEDSIKVPASPCYALSNHDKPRVATRWLNGRDRVLTAKQLLAMLFAMRGDICLYQGEELGLPEANVSYERLQDPFGKNFWPKFKGRDGCRTPMPWTNHVHGGFSQVEPWLPVDEVHRELNVESQEARPGSVLHFARQMIALRKARTELSQGTIRLIDAPEGVLAFSRQHEGRELVCLFNMDVTPKQMPAPDFKDMLSGQSVTTHKRQVTLGVCGFCFLEAV